MSNRLSSLCLPLFFAFCLPSVSRAQTPAPCAVLNVRDFGVKGDGATDDDAALNRALAAGIRRGPGTTVVIPAGTYCLGERTLASPPIRGGAHLVISNANGLTVRGEPGTLLLCRNLQRTLFSVEQSRNVTIRDLAIDANPLPYTQGTVKSCDPANGSVELVVDKGFDDLDRPDFAHLLSFRFFDSPFAEAWKEDHYFPNLVNRVRLGSGDWRLTPLPSKSGLVFHEFDSSLVGKKWMLWAPQYRGWAFTIAHCDNCLVENVKMYEVGSGSFELIANGNVTIRGAYMGPPPNSGRLFCGGGGMMSFFNRRTITVENCDFSHVDDDCFNMGTHFLRIVEKVDPQSCRTEAWSGDFVVGDTVSLWDWKEKSERAEAKITAAQKEKDGRWLVHFDRPMDIRTVGASNPSIPLKVQEKDGIDRLTDLDSTGSCILRHNKMSSMRARCFLVKSGHSVIEDNDFHDTHMPAILAGPEFYWGEGPQLRGLLISHNRFTNIDGPNISVAVFDSATVIANKDVTIKDNTFEDYGRLPVVYRRFDRQGVVIKACNTDGVTIEGNTIKPPPPGCPKVDPIEIDTCKNVQVKK